MKQHTLLDPMQIESTKQEYKNLYEQLEFGRFNSIKSGAAPTIYHELQASDGQTIFTLPQGTYTLGDHSLQVYVNGMYMREGIVNDYLEVDNKTIQFNYPLTSADVVVFRVNGGTSGASLHEDHQATAGQTAFQLTGSYTVGNRSLVVYVNGAYQTLGIDYTETNAKTVTFLEPLEAGDLVTFRVEGIPTIEQKYQESSTSMTYDNDGRIIREEVLGDRHVVKEFEYDAGGLPSRMIIREGGYVVTKTYTWSNGVCTNIETTVKEGES